MPWPRLGTFGFVDNPLIDTPFVENNEPGSVVPPPSGNFFLLMSGSDFLLMTGSKLLLQG